MHFDTGPRARLGAALPRAPLLPTGAGHDAGAPSGHLPAAMLFVRTPSGVSHASDEHVEDTDAETGADALTTVMRDLLAR